MALKAQPVAPRAPSSARKGSERARSGKPSRPRRNYPRWRAVSLSLVYLAFAVHIAHWKLTGQTLAPLELNEVMYTLELGIVTAGFLFMCLLVLGTLIFGRFFCSWACHIMVLQEACAWLLRKIGLQAKPIRSRLLLWVPPLTALYMFVWPQVLRAWESRSFPTFYFATDRERWASFVTSNFWRNLPGPWIIALTFLVCGFLMVYVLGSRTFCTYVCPYGAIFALADRFSPGRILVSDQCKQCGRCTETCTSGVRVHEEVKQHGMIVNPACMKCLDCASVCPQEALHFGWAKPALFTSDRSGGRFGLPYEFSIGEELLGAIVFLVVLLSFRGLYSRIPFLLSLGLGVMIAYSVVLWLRLANRGEVRFSKIVLKRSGRLSKAGMAYAGVMALTSALVAHSAFVRYHEYHGLRGALALSDPVRTATTRAKDVSLDQSRDREGAEVASPSIRTATVRERPNRTPDTDVRPTDRIPEADEPSTASAIAAAASQRMRLAAIAHHHLLTADRWGLFANERVERSLVTTAALLERQEDLTIYAGRYLSRHPDDAAIHMTVAKARAKRATNLRDFPAAAAELATVVQLDPRRASARADLGSALAELGRFDEAIAELKEALQLDESLGGATYNLGTLLLHVGRLDEAVTYLQQATRTLPDDADLYNNLGSALLQLHRLADAEVNFSKALALDPNHPAAHFNLGRVLAAFNRFDEAEQHLRRAASLDPRYERILTPHR